MRAMLVGVMLLLAACGGSGGEANDPAGGAVGFQSAAADFLTLLESEPPTELLGSAPRGHLELAGGAGGRLGWSDEALLAKADATVDFDRALISGRMHDAGIYSVPTNAPLMQAKPHLLTPLDGQVAFSGTIIAPSQAIPGVGFDLNYNGSFSGRGSAQNEVFSVSAQTPRGALLTENGKIHAYGGMSGTVATSQPHGGHSVSQTLREARIFMAER